MTQKRWAFEHCFPHQAFRTSKSTVCLECGHAESGPDHKAILANTLIGYTCPRCSAKLDVVDTRKRMTKDIEYFRIVTTFRGFQVVRFFYLEKNCSKGRRADLFISEVCQHWVSPTGKLVVLAKPNAGMFNVKWYWGAGLTVNGRDPLSSPRYRLYALETYPRKRVLPELLRNGLPANQISRDEIYRVYTTRLFMALLADPKTETLLKSGQTELLRWHIAVRKLTPAQWSAAKICIRNGYNIPDSSIWCDLVDSLEALDKDVRNARYVCPADLHAEHDRWMRKRRAVQDRREAEQRRRDILQQEEEFKKAKSQFFGLVISDGTIDVRALESVQEYLEEGDAMKHCVFTNRYYQKPDALILSARMGDQRIETVEVSLKSLEVVQSRGVRNQNTEYHKRIVDLVNQNKNLIRKRLTEEA